jgi:hypothetical protein
MQGKFLNNIRELTMYNNYEEMYKPLIEVKKGEFVKRKDSHSKVYQKGDYDRSAKAFWLHDWSDISRSILVKGNKQVFCNFTF